MKSRVFRKIPFVRCKSDKSFKLDEATTRLCAIAGYASSGNLSKLAEIWRQMPVQQHATGVEIVLQNVLYNGFPRTLLAMTTIAEIGIKDRVVLEQPYPTSPTIWAQFDKRGEEVCKETYGFKYKRFLAHARLLHPAFGHWVQNFMCGRVRGRAGCDQKTRCLCELAGSAGQYVFPQFRTGILNALTAGAKIEEIRSVLDMTGEIWSQERQSTVDAMWRDINQKRVSGGWKIIPEDPASAQKLISSETITEAHLCSDWSHLLPAKQISYPPWRHPAVLSFSNVESLPDRVRIYALCSAHTASGNLSSLRRDWWFLSPEKHREGLEAVLQTVGLSGFHRLHNALRTLHEQGVCREAVHIKKEDRLAVETFARRGENVLRDIYSPTMSFSILHSSVAAMHPDFWNWIVEFAFGQVAGREVLSLAERELAVLPVLIGTSAFPQLQAHMHGALKAGATLDQIRGILDQTDSVWGFGPQAMVDGYWSDFAEHFARVQKPSD